jgi:plastocyanin
MVLIPRRLLAVVAATAALAGAAGLRPDAAGPGGGARANGTIRGRVEIRNAATDPVPRPGVAELGQSSTYRVGERRNAVVYLETAPQGAFESGSASRATMSQRNEAFVPHVLAVRVGTVIDFPNEDSVFHNVFSLSKTKRFDLGRYPRGQSKAIRVDEPGIVRVFCDIHSHMNAFILVFAHRFFDVTDEQGRYRIEQVPPGTYTLVAWYEGAITQTRSVTVPEDGGAIDADFTIR